jgi:hypothetical protein
MFVLTTWSAGAQDVTASWRSLGDQSIGSLDPLAEFYTILDAGDEGETAFLASDGLSGQLGCAG